MAPTMEMAVMTARWVGTHAPLALEEGGNISCVPWEVKFIIIIKRVR